MTLLDFRHYDLRIPYFSEIMSLPVAMLPWLPRSTSLPPIAAPYGLHERR